MKQQEREAFIQDFLREYTFPVLVGKGTEYSQGQEDCNSNFKRQADELDLTPEQVLKVYLNKHLDAISYAIKTGKYFGGSEPIYGRVGDAINYLLILASLIDERRYDPKLGGPSLEDGTPMPAYTPQDLEPAVQQGMDIDERIPPAPEDALPTEIDDRPFLKPKGSCF